MHSSDYIRIIYDYSNKKKNAKKVLIFEFSVFHFWQPINYCMISKKEPQMIAYQIYLYIYLSTFIPLNLSIFIFMYLYSKDASPLIGY